MKIEKPCRSERTYRQHLVATADEVFPLLCPVRECDWVPGWRPSLVVSDSGLVEEGCLFVTPSGIRDGLDATWAVVRHDPEDRRLSLLKLVPGVIATAVDIVVDDAADSGSWATIRYCHTSLSAEGDALVGAFTEEAWTAFMTDWEEGLNHYLATGAALADG
jgi:hypothetical protein